MMGVSTVPGGVLTGISGVESGNAAALVGGPPGIELHTMVEGVPGGDVGETFPVVVTTIGVRMVPNGVADVIAGSDIDNGGVATVDDNCASKVTSGGDDGGLNHTALVPGGIFAIGAAQVPTLSRTVGFEATDTSAN